MLKHSIRQNFGEGVISRFEQMRLDGWPNTAARLPLHKCYKSIPSDYSVSDNGCAHQMALKKNSVAIIGKIADEPMQRSTEVSNTSDKSIR
jgi:hypothetical protein